MHHDIYNTYKICLDCGMHIQSEIKYEKEWRFYGASDTRHVTDPNRCHMRKSSDKNIMKDVSNMGFSDRIVHIANEIYDNVSNGNIYRGAMRRAIIFACIFHAYKLENNPQSCDHLIKTFNLTKKASLKGLKFVSLYSDKNPSIKRSYITVENIINEIMNKFNASQEDINKIIIIYNKIKNKSSVLNRARPQSVAAGIIRYYCIKNNKEICMITFKNAVNLSELTINRISKEIENILK